MACANPNHAPALLIAAVAAACGSKPPPKKVVPKEQVNPLPKPVVTEEDRAKARLEAIHSLVPVGTSCLPQSFKAEGGPRLQLAAIGKEPVVCATDVDQARLLGNIACWRLGDLSSPSLDYQDPQPLPGRNITVKPDERCARGFCIPKDNKLADTVHMAWNFDGSKVVVVSADTAHIFDATARTRDSGFSIVGEETGVTNAPSAVYWVGDTIFVQGNDAGPAAYVWAFKSDGTPKGAVKGLGAKSAPINIYGGSFMILDGNRVALAERGFTTVTILEIDSGKRTKVSRALAGNPCKASEVDSYWADQTQDLAPKCKAYMAKTFEHLVGADAVSGRVNLLALLRGPRLGELAVLDIKNLRELDRFKLPWCDPGPEDRSGEAPKPTDPKRKSRGPATKGAVEEDPDAGGQ